MKYDRCELMTLNRQDMAALRGALENMTGRQRPVKGRNKTARKRRAAAAAAMVVDGNEGDVEKGPGEADEESDDDMEDTSNHLGLKRLKVSLFTRSLSVSLV